MLKATPQADWFHGDFLKLPIPAHADALRAAGPAFQAALDDSAQLDDSPALRTI
jgi:hypothetical protein